MSGDTLKHPQRRDVLRNSDDRREYELGRADGDAMAILGRGVNATGTFTPARLQLLAEDLPSIRRDIEARRMKQALDTAASALGMAATELLGLLPAQTGAALLGWCTGLLGKDPTRFMADETDPDPWADEDAEPEPRRRLYGGR